MTEGEGFKCELIWFVNLQLSIMTVGCALAQNVNDGRYYPEVYASKFDDGKWRPDNNGQYRGTPDKFGAGGKRDFEESSVLETDC